MWSECECAGRRNKDRFYASELVFYQLALPRGRTAQAACRQARFGPVPKSHLSLRRGTGALRYGSNWAYPSPTNGRASVPAGRRASGPYRSRVFRRRQTPASPGSSVPAGSASEPRDGAVPLAAPDPDVSFGFGTRRWEGYRSPMSRCVVVRGRFGTAPTGRTRTRRMVAPRYPQAGALRARTEVASLAGTEPQRAPALRYRPSHPYPRACALGCAQR